MKVGMRVMHYEVVNDLLSEIKGFMTSIILTNWTLGLVSMFYVINLNSGSSCTYILHTEATSDDHI